MAARIPQQRTYAFAKSLWFSIIFRRVIDFLSKIIVNSIFLTIKLSCFSAPAEARTLDPDPWATYLHLGKAKLKLHDNADAVRYLQQAAEMNRDEARLFLSAGKRTACHGTG